MLQLFQEVPESGEVIICISTPQSGNIISSAQPPVQITYYNWKLKNKNGKKQEKAQLRLINIMFMS